MIKEGFVLLPSFLRNISSLSRNQDNVPVSVTATLPVPCSVGCCAPGSGLKRKSATCSTAPSTATGPPGSLGESAPTHATAELGTASEPVMIQLGFYFEKVIFKSLCTFLGNVVNDPILPKNLLEPNYICLVFK